MANKKELRYYKTENGKMPFVDWLNQFRDYITRSRIERRLERMELGHYGDYKPLGDGVFELKLAFGPGYRVYFSEYDDFVVILLCGGDKSTQKRDINTAKQYWQELKERL